MEVFFADEQAQPRAQAAAYGVGDGLIALQYAPAIATAKASAKVVQWPAVGIQTLAAGLQVKACARAQAQARAAGGLGRWRGVVYIAHVKGHFIAVAAWADG